MRIGSMLAITLGLLTSGCATVVSDGVNGVGTLELDLPRNDGKVFYLFDGGRQPISRAVANQGKLVFQLPNDRYVGKCASVTDPTGKPMFGDKRSAYLAVRTQYQDELSHKQSLAPQSNDAATTERQARSQIDAATQRLRTNRAFADSACAMPAQMPVPPRPFARCKSQQECLQDGAAICFTRYLGAKGCGYALDQFKVPGLLSSPGCASLAAQLAGQKYEMGDALVDALHGIAADAARNLIRSNSIGDNILGLIIAGTSEYLQLEEARSCTHAFVERQFAPLRDWMARAEQIRTEPGLLLASCQRDLASVPTLVQQVGVAASKARELGARVDAIDARLKKLAGERRPIEWCENRR